MKTNLNSKILVAVLTLVAPAAAFAADTGTAPVRPVLTEHVTQAVRPQFHTDAAYALTPATRFNLVDGQPIR
jgi:hypothetical protein